MEKVLKKEKEIEEMANLLISACGVAQYPCQITCEKCHAERLYNAGYRKTSDVAKEIFCKIENLMDLYKYFCDGNYDKELETAVTDLKKKYIGEKEK